MGLPKKIPLRNAEEGIVKVIGDDRHCVFVKCKQNADKKEPWPRVGRSCGSIHLDGYMGKHGRNTDKVGMDGVEAGRAYAKKASSRRDSENGTRQRCKA